jgi:dTDP-glucose 4,6-dehydratase
VPDRPGHDRRYAIDSARAHALGWVPRVAFDDGIRATVAWYRANEPWWRAARDHAWDGYYDRQYGWRLARSTPA